MDEAYVHYGASTSAVESWLNFDASPTVRVQNLPVIGPALSRLAGNGFSFPGFLRYGDIVRGLPVADGSAQGVFASHVLEHLSLEDMRTALANTWRMLRPGGIFRLIVPDLKERARRYVAAADDDAEAAHRFMRSTDLGVVEGRRGLLGGVRRALGFSRHEWMWDHAAMSQELRAAGFGHVRRAAFGDAADPMFARVEQADRYHTGDIEEVAIEALRPM